MMGARPRWAGSTLLKPERGVLDRRRMSTHWRRRTLESFSSDHGDCKLAKSNQDSSRPRAKEWNVRPEVPLTVIAQRLPCLVFTLVWSLVSRGNLTLDSRVRSQRGPGGLLSLEVGTLDC